MPAETTTDSSPTLVESVGKRKRGRRNVIGNSPNRDVYVRLMEGGWSSLSLERFASHRYAEDIPASTFRTYKSRSSIVTDVSRYGDIVDPEKMIDVLRTRSELVQLQMERIRIDHEHEKSMSKLFGSTSREIDLLAKLLDQTKADQQDVGLFPKLGESVTITAKQGPSAGEAPKHRSLAEALGAAPESGRELAKVLHLALGRPLVETSAVEVTDTG